MLIVLNNKSHFETENFKSYQKELSKIRTKHELVLCPSFIHLKGLNFRRISLGSQNVSAHPNGSYTGEVSAKQLKDLGVKYSIVGHSERIKYCHESKDDIKKKIEQLLKHNIIPILCIGEEKKEDFDDVKEKFKEELSYILNGLDYNKIIIAYEPYYLVNSEANFNKESIKKVTTYLRKLVPNSIVLYGGNINEDNVSFLCNDNIVDGFLLGRLSLYPDRLKNMLKKIKY